MMSAAIVATKPAHLKNDHVYISVSYDSFIVMYRVCFLHSGGPVGDLGKRPISINVTKKELKNRGDWI